MTYRLSCIPSVVGCRPSPYTLLNRIKEIKSGITYVSVIQTKVSMLRTYLKQICDIYYTAHNLAWSLLKSSVVIRCSINFIYLKEMRARGRRRWFFYTNVFLFSHWLMILVQILFLDKKNIHLPLHVLVSYHACLQYKPYWPRQLWLKHIIERYETNSIKHNHFR